MDNVIIKKIEQVFEKLIGEEVIVITDRDIIDNLDIAIYYKNKYKGIDINKLHEYLPDFVIFEENDEWYYSYTIHSIGSWKEPPYSELVDCDVSYNLVDDALSGLYEHIMSNMFTELIYDIELKESLNEIE